MRGASFSALISVATVAFSLSLALAKDPAEGWLGYATAVSPSGSGRITFAEAYWIVPENPSEGGAFYSPWFGIEVHASLACHYEFVRIVTPAAEQRQPEPDSGSHFAPPNLTLVVLRAALPAAAHVSSSSLCLRSL